MENMKLSIMNRKDERSPWFAQTVGLAEAVDIIFEQAFALGVSRLMDPLWLTAFALTGKCYAFSEFERMNNQNCATLRAALKGYV